MVEFTPDMVAEDSATGHWSGTGKLRGGRWGIWFFITALRVLGLRLTYVLTVPLRALFFVRLARRPGHDGFSPPHFRPATVVETPLARVPPLSFVWPRDH